MSATLGSMYDYRPRYIEQEVEAFYAANPEVTDGLPIDVDERICTQHYCGNSSVDTAITSYFDNSSVILDAGSGLGGVARYICHKYPHVEKVVCVEFNQDFLSISNRLTAKTNFRERIKYINSDLAALRSKPEASDYVGKVDGIISFLCFLHIANKQALFSELASMLKVGGKMYIEDFIATTGASSDEKSDECLSKTICCALPLPTQEEYTALLHNAGFEIEKFDDVTDIWRPFIQQRAVTYRTARDQLLSYHEPAEVDAYEHFFDEVAWVFTERDVVRGAKILARRIV